MSSVLIKEREREWDDSGSIHSVRSSQPRTFTTVRRYKYPGRVDSDDYEENETRIVFRDRDAGSDSRERVQYRVVEREREEDSARGRDIRDSYRIIRRQSRSPSPEVESREIQITRERELEHDTRSVHSPYTLEKYSKSTEYFSRPEPQPIVIRQEAPQPIIIQEQPRQQQIIVRREEPSYEVITRSETTDDRQLAPRPRRDEEDYYYERRTREIDRGRRESEYSNDERERHRHRYDDRDYYSDDDVYYVRREREGFDDDYDYDKRHKRHLAEGVLGGVAAAELVRHHRKRQGENPGSHIGQVVGYGALGAVGAEALTRLNNRRDRSRSRDRAEGRGRHRHRHGGRSRSRSLSRGKALAGVAALAGLGALAYAAGKNNSKGNTTIIEEGPRRSRSRRRRSSVVEADFVDESRARSESRHMDPEHRNRRVAQAGLAGAALAGLVERARSRSKSRKRSRSRVREGVPIVAAGLGSAAVAGLYERVKNKKEEKRMRSRSRSYSRPRSRSRSVLSSRRGSHASDTALVEYGGDPIYSSSAMERRRSRSRSGSRGRHRYSSHSSPDRRRSSRSRSRSKHLAEAAVAAGAAGVAAHEFTKRKERKRAESERRQREDEAAADPYPPSDNSHYYPASNEFAPPPNAPGPYMSGANPSYADPGYGAHALPRDAYPPYNPADYGPTTGPTLPADEHYHHHDPYAADARREGEYRPPDHVSAPLDDATLVDERSRHHVRPDGLNDPYVGASTPTATSHRETSSTVESERENEKSVKFDLDPAQSEATTSASDRDISSDDVPRRRMSAKHERNRDHDYSHSSSIPPSKRFSRNRDLSPASDDSSETIEEPDLADRFDNYGRRKPERGNDPLADRIEDLLSGEGMAGRILSSLFDGGGNSRHSRR